MTTLPNVGGCLEFLDPSTAYVYPQNLGTYVPDSTDTSGYNSDKAGVSFVTFDSTSGSAGKATPRIFVGVATNTSDNIFISNDAGSTCQCTSV